MTVTTYGASGVSPRTTLFAVDQMLAHAQPVIILGKMGMTKPMPRNKSKTIKFRRPVPFTVSTAPLSEGVTPAADLMQFEDVSADLNQYGRYVTVSDRVEDEHEDPVLMEASKQLGELAGATVEQIIYNVVKGGTGVSYANGSARTDVNTPITLNKIRAVVRTLMANKAKYVTSVLDGSPDYHTFPVQAAYVAVCHVHLAHDLRNLQGFTPVAEYGTRKTVSEHEIGCVEDVRFVLSPDLAPFADGGGAKAGSGTTMVSTTGTSADVYPVIIMGQDFFGQVPLKGRFSLSPTVVNAKPSDSDPLGQRTHVGIKFTFTSLILNEDWGHRLEVAATAL